MKVLGIGESVIDTIINDESNTKHIGGPSPIALMLLARLGASCTLMTTLGRDENADIIEKTLAKEKITVIARREEKTKMNTYTINTDTGARTKVRGTVIHNHINNLDAHFVNQFDLVIIDRHEKEAFRELRRKKQEKTKILIDTSVEVSPDTLDMIQYADYPIIPIEAAEAIGLQKLITIAKKPVIITAGPKGSIVYDGTYQHYIPAFSVKAVDVQGAGDVYRGAFGYGILHNWEMAACAAFANKAAALHCTRLGNAAAVPTRNEIMNSWQLAL